MKIWHKLWIAGFSCAFLTPMIYTFGQFLDSQSQPYLGSVFEFWGCLFGSAAIVFTFVGIGMFGMNK